MQMVQICLKLQNIINHFQNRVNKISIIFLYFVF